ncbi:leucyl aminopeptidase [Candidatus Babeliales bacterium]|nr:leucyl aminopeptidase [Candidatus Babeliales bacterium]
MIIIKPTSQNFWDNQADSYIFFVNESLETESDNANFTKIEEYYPHVKAVLKKHNFEGKQGQSYVLTAMQNDRLVEFIFMGLGKHTKSWDVELEKLRRTLGSAILLLKKHGLRSAVMGLPEAKPYTIGNAELMKQLVVTAHMADYEFMIYKTKEPKKDWSCTISVVVDANEEQALAASVKQGDIMGEAINQARHWADTPANVMTPTALADEAEKIAKQHNLKCTIFGREQAEKLGMGAWMAVDAGSDQPGKFVVLEYKAQSKDKPTIALLGKGVMFDSGGISLKGSDYMTGMKYDMSGAAAVIASMKIFAQLNPDINVVGLTPLVENMPSGKASRQDDIVTAMNGKTIEIQNTDAEGRLILSDTMCYAEKFYNPDVMIDIATLTGACLFALGYFYTGLMTQDEELMRVLPEIGKKTGDRVWPLPLDDDFKPANNSLVADLSNSGSRSYKAGTITAACFLSEFVSKARWAHLDIAGTADGVPGNISYLGKTSAGAGIRLLVDFVLNFKK